MRNFLQVSVSFPLLLLLLVHLSWSANFTQANNLTPSAPSTSTAAAAGNDVTNSSRGSSEKTESDCDLGGRTIRVAVSLQPPLVDCGQDIDGEWNCNGSNVEAIKVLQQRLNFRVEWLVLSTSGNHRQRRTTAVEQQQQQQQQLSSEFRDPKRQTTTSNSSNAVLALVESGRAWLSANGYMSIINGRDRQPDGLRISRAFDVFRMHFLLSKSVRDHDHIFVKPFNSQAWAAILSSAFLVAPAFYLINKTSCFYRHQDVRYLHRISWLQCLRFGLARASSRLAGSRCCRWWSCLGRRKSSGDSIVLPDERDIIVAAQSIELPLSKQQQQQQQQQSVGRTKSERRRLRLIRKQLASERRRQLRRGRRRRRSGFFRLAYVVWYVIGSLAAQGGETEDLPEADSIRILVAFWWLYLIVICSIHSGILTAILTFPKQNDFIQSLDDFLALERNERTGMRLIVDKFSEISTLLADPQSSHRSPLQELLVERSAQLTPDAEKRIIDNNRRPVIVPIVEVDLSRHRERILDEVQRGQSAYLEEKSAINLIITQEYLDQKAAARCQFKSSRYPIDLIPMSLALSRRRWSRVCLARIDSILGRIMQTGLAQKWRRKFDAQGNDCLETVIINAGDVSKIELKHVELAFWLLGAGLVMGTIILAAELIWLFTSELEEEFSAAAPKSSSGSASLSLSSSSSSLTSSPTPSSSSDSESDDDGAMRLGHKVAPLAQRSLRSLKLDRPSKLIKIKLSQELALLRRLPDSRQQSAAPQQTDTLPAAAAAAASTLWAGFVEPANEPVGALDVVDAVVLRGAGRNKRRRDERRKRRLARAAERRSKRLKRTIGLVKRLHEGKLYLDLVPKVSGKIQARTRRASHAIVSHFSSAMAAAAAATTTTTTTIPPTSQLVGSGSSSMLATTDRGAGAADGMGRVRRRRLNNNIKSSRVAPATGHRGAAAAETTVTLT